MVKTSRRKFLQRSVIGLGSAFLAACGVNQSPPPTATPLLQVSNMPTTAQVLPTATPRPKASTGPTTTPKPKGKNLTSAPTSRSANTQLIAAEILGCPTNTSVTANVVPAVAMEIYYEYGTTPGAYSARTAAQKVAAGLPLETLITGLQPNTRYYYQIHAGSEVGPERTFVTQRAPGSPFTFAIQGDSHPERLGKQFDPTLYERTLLSAGDAQPDFYIAIGDDFSVDTLKTVNAEVVRSLYVTQRQWLGLAGAPVFLVNGNHEQAALANLDGTPNNVAVWAQTARNAYYPQPAPDHFYSGDSEQVAHIGLLRDYYAFTWGDALFVVIDPYWHSPQTVDNQFGVDRDDKKKRDLWNITLGEAQYQWFKRTLETSTARHKFVFAHHVNGTGRGGIELAHTYEWGDAAGFAAHRPGWSKPIHQLMVANGVTIFFQGHDHIFVRQELDGVIYQTLPEPAHPFYTYENEDAFESGEKFPNSGHVRVTVSAENVKVDYVRSYLDKPDELAFSYTPKPKGKNSTPGPAATPAKTNTTIILGRPTDTTITANLVSAVPAEIHYEYGTGSGVYAARTAAQNAAAGVPIETQIDGLQPNTRYYYKVIANGTPSEEHSFQTQRAPGSPFTFTLEADPHNREPNFNSEIYVTTLANARADHPDFHINLGDTFMTEKIKAQTYAEVETTISDLRPYFGLIAADAPLFLVNGNHEGELGWLLRGKDKDMPLWSTQLRQRYYPNPKPSGFYSGSSSPDPILGSVRDGYFAWTWGDALLIALDPFWYTISKPQNNDLNTNWNWTLGKEQYNWLKSTLETSQAKFKLVFTHHLIGGSQDARGGVEAAKLFEWGGNNADGSYGFDTHRPGWGKPIHALLVANHVQAVFHGHDHVFVKQDLDGIVYQELPQPSNADSNQIRLASEYGYLQGEVRNGSGHLRVTVKPDQATIEYVCANLQNNPQIEYTYTIG